ncbi:anion exchange transporter isoform X2 [Bufo gargarizans]|uniref:anion exchange transporter isoform X2 n=1 Tax=Bufo gargarizans TaxID=30331 RepID=UPI001CF3C1E5|nr:anion exchange transporter isoform X2 [Bufo gargarizans]
MTSGKPCRKGYLRLVWGRLSTISLSEVRRWWLRRIPILEWAPRYKLQENFIPDLITGMMLSVQQVAQGLAFAVMSSVHPVFGLYGSFFSPLIYAFFGMGRHVFTGTFAITSLISCAAVERLVPLNSNNVTNASLDDMGLSDFEMQRIGVAAAVTFLGGVIQMSMFLLNLGCTTILLSEPVVSAMTTGAATHVVTSQVKFLLGMKMPYISGPLGMFHIYIYIFKNINLAHIGALLLSIVSLVVLILTKELNEKFKSKIRFVIPIDLALIISASLACYFADMSKTYGFDVIGPIPKGIPLPKVPPMDTLQHVVVEAFGVAIVGYAVSIFLAYNSSKKFKYPVCENQELLAHGLSNIIPSFFFCIPNSGAPVRSFLSYSVGSKTQVASLISCALVLFVIYFVAPLLYWLPMCVLAAIIVVGLKGMLIQFRDLKKYWNVDKFDWVIWICTYLVTICFAANIGLLFGVVFSIAVGVLRLTRAKILRVVNMHEEYSTETEDKHSEVKVISVGAPLVFLNAKRFHKDVLEMNRKFVTRRDSCMHTNGALLMTTPKGFYNGQFQHNGSFNTTLILDCSGVPFLDYTGVTTLTQMSQDLREYDTAVLFSGCSGESGPSCGEVTHLYSYTMLNGFCFIISASLVKALKFCGSKHEHFFTTVKAALDALKVKTVDRMICSVVS